MCIGLRKLFKMSSNFGDDFNKIWPTTKPELTNVGRKLLNDCLQLAKPVPLNIEEVVKKSVEFPIQFPIDTCRIYKQPDDRRPIIQEEIASAYPVIHERVVSLYLRFLEHKIQYGSQIEKEIYSNMSLASFVDRLLSKRCVTFYNSDDTYLLISGERGFTGFEKIGTDNETPPLLLRNCLSYDEIKLSALLSVSSHTEFINNGTRSNGGKVESDLSKIEQTGVIIGIIGARISEMRYFMEFQDIVISESQNTIKNGYGNEPAASENSLEFKTNFDYRQIWNEFYNESGILFSAVSKSNKRFGDCCFRNDLFDNVVMKKRYTISFDTLLLESEARAAAANKQAYIHVVGIGLGVWRAADQQEAIFLETFSQRITWLADRLKHISYIDFSYFSLKECANIKNGNTFLSKEHPNGGIQVFMSTRDPSAKLSSPQFDNCLLVVSYAWDGNALPGNEFWVGMLKATGDPAAACSTLITELHNPHINTTMVSGKNLHIASPDLGVIHISDYAKYVIESQ